MAEIPNVCLSLSSRSENVLVVRQALTGVAEAIALDPVETNDLITAVTEAANNVVLHAYGGEEGPLEVEVYVRASGVEVVVRDHGRGIGLEEAPTPDGPVGIGLPVIHALTDDVELKDLAGEGTEVRMTFQTPKAGALEPFGEDGLRRRTVGEAELASTIEVALAPIPLARAVLPRILTVLAARAHFSTVRISDLGLIAGALATHAGDSLDGSHLSVGIDLEPRRLRLRVGPLRAGRARTLILDPARDGVGPAIERLAADHSVAPEGSSEMLALQLVEPR